ncbi:MAG: FixH family protein [Pseudomonadota bacterium]
MSRPIVQNEDLEPWYKQFWPWFLIVLPGSVVVASLVTLFIANYGADDLVVDDYYKVGLSINRQLEKKQRSEDLGISASLGVTERHITVRTSGPVSSNTLNLLLSHPLEADKDIALSLVRIAPGIYQSPLPTAVAPRWHWTLDQEGSNGWRLDGNLESYDFSDRIKN